MSRIAVRITAVLAALAAASTAVAQPGADYPTRSVRMVVPFAPGGASVIVGRIIGPRLSQQFGQQVVVDNRAGASGDIGVEIVARATPDGYTILLGNSGTMAINPAVFPKFPGRPLRDLIAVIQVVDVPGTLTPVEYQRTIADLVNFLDYMGEPAKNKRLSLGLIVLLYLGVLFLFAYWLKREYWKEVH